jgi:NADPH:quinone reductase-like Zn-dependent oxidoreductase
MKALQATDFGISALRQVEVDMPSPRPGQIVLRVLAASLNYRDLAILSGSYLPDLPLPYVPASDACGEVIAVGEGVERFRVGDRVAPVYIQGWHDGPLTPEQRSKCTLGGPLAGVLQQYIVVPEQDAVHVPASLTAEEASTLPIAALTAWSALSDGQIEAGDTVLVQGSGGVALFALQFAKAAGATVIATSSSAQKLERLRALGADHVINYRTHPDWAGAVKEVTDGRGADIVVETGGSTLPQSLSATAFGGHVAVVGFVAGYQATIGVRQLIGPMLRVQGVVVGSRTRFEDMIRSICKHGIQPVIDSVFAFEDARFAFERLESGSHFGKIVVRL